MTSGVESVWKWVQKYEPVLSARSMLKIRIVHKGIILVAVPLLVGIVFNSLLCYDIYQTNRHVQRQLLLKDATISYIKSVRCATGTKLCMMSYLFSQDPYYKDSYQSLKKEALEANAHLKKLLKHEKGITIPELDLSSRNMMMGGRGRYGGGQKEMMASEHPFFQELNRMCNAETAYALQSLSTVQISMIVGVVISALIAIALAVFFCLNITNRLLIILSNTISLSKGTSLNPPLKGNDEIAELDQFLFKSANEIRVLERFKKQMIGVVSHELKSPLSSVASFLSSMSTGVYGEISQKAKDKIERAYASVKRLMGLVAELLYLDRLELEITPANVSVAEIIETSVDTVKELSEQSGIDLVVNNTAKQVFADRNRLVQVIVNLVSNAMKFSPAYGTVKIEGKESDAYFECRITDQGKGIPESFRKTIFEPFKQVVASDSTAKKGTGLGLTISKSIVEQHGGIIGVDSEEGKGSTFWFKIPISESAFAAARVPGGEPALLPAAKGKVNGNRKFSVLQQGLVIISVPLIFQVLFVAVVNSKIIQIREQTHREENSKEVLDILNRMSEGVTRTAQFGTMGVYAGNPEYLERWEHGKQDALDLLDRATKLSASDPLKRKDIDDTKKALDDISNLLSSESKKRQNQTKVEDFAEKAGLGEMLNIARKHPREMMAMESMDPQNPEAEISNPSGGMSQLFQMMRERGGQQHRSEQSGGVEGNLSRQRGTGTGANARSEGKVAELNVRPGRNESESKAGANAGAEARSEADPNANNEKVPVRGLSRLFQMMRRGGQEGAQEEGEGGSIGSLVQKAAGMGGMGGIGGLMSVLSEVGEMGGIGGMGGLGMISQFRSMAKDSVPVKITRPFVEGEAAQERLMDRETALGQKLSKQRELMIKNLGLTLLGGFVLSIGLSLFLALSIMRSLTGRLQHVMENTTRLVNRESLHPPKGGTDEIAALDKVLYETGNHLIELEVFKRELIAMVSHELRTPLLSVSSALQLFSAGAMGELSEKASGRLRLAQEESDRLIRLINDLLDIEKMEAGKFMLDITQFKISDVVAVSINSVRALAESKLITIESKCFDDDFTMSADRDRVCQVLINLLSNAVKYSPQEGKIRISVDKVSDAQVKFAVVDSGRGVPEELRQKIFDRFVQVEESDATVRGGSGLGLAISKAIVEQHAGRIGVDSEIGAGSKFWFSIPVNRE